MWVLAAVLILLGLLLVSPVRMRFTLFYGEPVLEIRLLFFRLRLPAKGKKKAQKKKKTKTNAAKKADGRVKKKKASSLLSGPWDGERIRSTLLVLKDLLAACGRAGGFFLKGLRLKKLWLEIMVVRPDAHQTAVESGKLNAWFYGALSFLQNYVQPRDLYLRVYPGFWAAQETVAAEAILSFTIARLLGALLLLLAGSLKPLFTFIQSSQNKGELSHAAAPEEAEAAHSDT